MPQVLIEGNHEAIRRWRRKQALGRTSLRRPDLLGDRELSDEDRRLRDQRQSIEHLYKDQAAWIETLKTVSIPYLRVVAALVPPEL